ncbi:MAG: hypothetical protein A3J29_13820 [Acidobacteria bacterium RIFCSPLOWO2_12_FULL_67_14b]|nr:MAG: hypothetical protein A3J29_13820 [Acidobacteria bacterium RIFCSPLOWO2_12_FULL_67_14b]
MKDLGARVVASKPVAGGIKAYPAGDAVKANLRRLMSVDACSRRVRLCRAPAKGIRRDRSPLDQILASSIRDL